MIKSYKKTLIIFVVIFLITYFLFTHIKYGKYSYNFLNKNDTYYIELFNSNIKKSIFLDYIIGNENEQIYCYTFQKKFDLIVWNINGFSEVDLSQLHLYIIDEFHKIDFINKRFSEFDGYTISSALNILKAKQLLLYSSKGADIVNHFESEKFSYLNIISKGLVISDSFEYKIKIESKKSMHYNFAFIKSEIGFQFVILTSKNADLEDDMLLKMLKYSVP